jgi:HEAT repeat protein
MIELAPRLILAALVALWSLILLTTLALVLVHAVRATRTRRRERLDARARPLVIRFALAEDEDPALAQTLRRAGGAFGERIDERLLSVLETLRGEARGRIAAMLVERGHPARLRRRARARRTPVRAAALRRLGQLALPLDASLVRGAVADRAPIVRTVAVRAIASYASADAVEAVLEQLRGRGEVPSLVVVTSLIDQGARSPEALAAIRAGLGDARPTVRAACAQALGELTSAADAERLGLLLRRDPTPSVQLAAATALQRVGRTSSVPALLEATRSPWGPVRTHALRALLALPRDVTAEAIIEVSRRGDALLAPLLPPSDPDPVPGS